MNRAEKWAEYRRGEINQIDARLVNDDRAGNLPGVREQFERAFNK